MTFDSLAWFFENIINTVFLQHSNYFYFENKLELQSKNQTRIDYKRLVDVLQAKSTWDF